MLNIIMCIQLFILSPTAKTQFYHPKKPLTIKNVPERDEGMSE